MEAKGFHRGGEEIEWKDFETGPPVCEDCPLRRRTSREPQTGDKPGAVDTMGTLSSKREKQSASEPPGHGQGGRVGEGDEVAGMRKKGEDPDDESG